MLHKIISVNGAIVLENGTYIYDAHEQDCCESHYLNWEDVDASDLVGHHIDLNDFFERVEGYGIRIKLVDGHPVSIAGHGSNNGYYSNNLSIIVAGPDGKIRYDISECQEIY
jgi:hypothetical protein